MAKSNDPMDEIRKTHRRMLRGAGGSDGGCGLFAIGAALAAAGVYLLLHSVHVRSTGSGLISGGMRGWGGGGVWETTSMGIVFVPFVCGVIMLFYNSELKGGWALMYLGLAVIVVEIFSRMRFVYDINLVYLLLMIVMIAAGGGLIMRSFRDAGATDGSEEKR